MTVKDENATVRIAVWQNNYDKVNIKDNSWVDEAVVVCCLKIGGATTDRWTECTTTNGTQVWVVDEAFAKVLRDRAEAPENTRSISQVFEGGIVDYEKRPAEALHMTTLLSLIVPEKVRDFPDDLFECGHCLLDDIQAMNDSDPIVYMGCPKCKKKQCDHKEKLVPFFLANVLLTTFDARVKAKAIGEPIQQILGIPSEDCVPNDKGECDKLEIALAHARSQPYDCKFIVGKYSGGSKNVVELVSVRPTIDLTKLPPQIQFPEIPMRMVASDSQGTPPCAINAVERRAHELKLLYHKPINTIQLLVTICDVGNEDYVFAPDEQLVRITRHAMCALSSGKVALHRTCTVQVASKYAKWNMGDVIYIIGRIMNFDTVKNIWHIALTAEHLLSPTIAPFFNTYFKTYYEYVSECMKQPQIKMDKAWTPKKRRLTISEDSASTCSMTPRTINETPIKQG